jgi:hypothetical protein
MRKLLIFAIWSTVVAGVLAAMFAPGFGLIHGGPLSAVGLSLLGLAMIRHTGAARGS